MTEKQLVLIIAVLLHVWVTVLVLIYDIRSLRERIDSEQPLIDSLQKQVLTLEDWAEDIVPMWRQPSSTPKHV